MEDMVILPKSDWVDILDGIKEKSGTNEPLKSGEVRAVVDSISAGGGGGSNKLAQFIERTLTEITAEDLAGVTSIGAYAFYSCKDLTRVELTNSVTKIEGYAFYNCDGLVDINMPDSVKSIVGYAFCDCGTIKSIVFSKNSQLTDVGYQSFAKCKGLTKVIFGSKFTTLNNMAFSGCTSMQVFDFSNCTSVIRLSATSVFYDVPSTCQFILPDALYDSWINATNWSALTVNYVKKSEYVEGADV